MFWNDKTLTKTVHMLTFLCGGGQKKFLSTELEIIKDQARSRWVEGRAVPPPARQGQREIRGTSGGWR